MLAKVSALLAAGLVAALCLEVVFGVRLGIGAWLHRALFVSPIELPLQ